MACRHGEPCVGAQGDVAAYSAGQAIDPAGLTVKDGNHCRMGDEPNCADLGPGMAEERARLEGGAVEGELESRCMPARTDDLHQAEAIDRRSLERLGQS